MVKQRTTNNGTTAAITKRTSAQAGSTVAKARGRKSNVGAKA
ncbi:152_t:CDS:2 [Dentiscutata heterogama]|uniref:152_t:CDS:1 n=1 Tax=Dentiscutata heterogama TaxID=1316150 RepID=A0ACA9L602_9GLOM|nr:152_t:CDS:2 [Dentiscutata heterogama]